MTYFQLEDAEPEGFVPESAWDAAADPSLPEGAAVIDGRRVDWDRVELLAQPEPPGFLVPQVLLDDYAGWGEALNDYLAAGLRGDLPPSPPRQPKRHRCLACWLVSLLPGHDRCQHGRLTGCEECESDW